MGGRDLKAVRGTDVVTSLCILKEPIHVSVRACVRDEGVSKCLVAAVEESCYVRGSGRAGSALKLLT